MSSIEFDAEAAAIRAGTISWHGPRPKTESYRRSLMRYNACMLDGIIPSDVVVQLT